MDIERLKGIGGSEWIKGDMHRIYFNNVEELYGLSVDTYNTGNISHAELDGEVISNGRAKDILAALPEKFWFDVKSGKFEYRGMRRTTQAIIDKLVDGIETRI